MRKYFAKTKTWLWENWPIWVLFLISATAYHAWFSFAIFAHGDYGFSFPDTLRDFLHYSAWDAQRGMGTPNLVLWMWFWKILPGFFGIFSWGSDIWDKFLFFWPIIFLTPLFSYLLTKVILKNKSGAFVAALVFSFNTYYLAIDTQGHFSLTLAGTFALLALYFFWRYFETSQKKNLIASALVCLVVGGYDFRVVYILFFILLALPLWFLATQKRGEKKSFFRQHFSAMALFFGLLFIFNLFWLMPTAVMGSLASNDIVARELIPNNFYLDLGKTLTLFHPFWNGSEPVWFSEQKIPVYFWLIPIMVLLGAYWNRRNKKILFWFIVALFAVFISKQNALPLKSAYIWLHQNFPGFNAFREASKFYFAIALSYAILIGAFVTYIFEHWAQKKYLKYSVFFLASLVFLWNTKPILTGAMYAMFRPNLLSADNLKLHTLISGDSATFRTLWIQKPLAWGQTYSDRHPIVDVVNDSPWKKLPELGSIPAQSSDATDAAQQLFSQNFATRLLAESGVRYLIVDNSQLPVTMGLLDNLVWKKLDLGLSSSQVFEDQSVRPRIYLTDKLETIHRDLDFQAVETSQENSARWNFRLKNLSGPVWLNFSEHFHPDWELVCGKTSWYALLGKTSIGEHSETDAGLNAYRIDPAEAKGKCGEEADGSIALSLYYRQQSYLYLGGTISLMAIFFSLVTLVFWREKGYIKKVEQKEKDGK